MEKELYFDKANDVLWRIPSVDFSNMPNRPLQHMPQSEKLLPVECKEIFGSASFGQFYSNSDNYPDNVLRVFEAPDGRLAILLPWYVYEWQMCTSSGIWVSDKMKFGYKELIICESRGSGWNPDILFKNLENKWGLLSVKEDEDDLPQLWVETLVEPQFDTMKGAFRAANIEVLGSHFVNVRDRENPYISEELMRYTPDKITELNYNEIFVFGSNLQGQHGGGAARLAHQKFGAVWGLGVGLAGQSYAIPTMHGGIDAVKPYVDQFIDMARMMKDKKFYVTKIGCGIAGFTVAEMAPLFKDALELENVALPREFVEYIRKVAK